MNLTIIQVYAPTAGTEKDEIESFYVSIQEETDCTLKMLIIIGGWNTKVRNKAEPDAVGKFGLGDRNEVSDKQPIPTVSCSLGDRTEPCWGGHTTGQWRQTGVPQHYLLNFPFQEVPEPLYYTSQ